MNGPRTSMISQADLFARACASLDTGRTENLGGLALEGRSRKPTQAEASAWAAVMSAAAGELDDAVRAVDQALRLEADNDAFRQVRISILRRLAAQRVAEQHAEMRARRSVFGRFGRS